MVIDGDFMVIDGDFMVIFYWDSSLVCFLIDCSLF